MNSRNRSAVREARAQMARANAREKAKARTRANARAKPRAKAITAPGSIPRRTGTSFEREKVEAAAGGESTLSNERWGDNGKGKSKGNGYPIAAVARQAEKTRHIAHLETQLLACMHA